MSGERGAQRVCARRVVASLHARAHYLQLGLHRQEVGAHREARGKVPFFYHSYATQLAVQRRTRMPS
jgi:hypothetical protein